MFIGDSIIHNETKIIKSCADLTSILALASPINELLSALAVNVKTNDISNIFQLG
jgi:hypothetical protein